MLIRRAGDEDAAAIWAMLEPVIRAGESFALDRAMGRAAALGYWRAADHACFVAEEAGAVVGSYYLRANQAGGGAHVGNCGYVVAAAATGRGAARRMAEHSIEMARAAGFRAMQFNFVIETNARAVELWLSLGFAVAGRLPGAFAHPGGGYVDALVMFQTL